VKKGTKEGTKKGTHPRLTLRETTRKSSSSRSSAMQASQQSLQQQHTIYTITAPLPISAASSECRKSEVASDAPKSTIATKRRRQSLKKVSQTFGVNSMLGFSMLTLTLLTYFLETEI
jgi:hypothetical protein